LKNNINIVYDIGANIGQFAKRIRKEGYEETIVSFEPLSIAHQSLCKSSLSDKKWIVHERVAIGDSIDTVEINISNNSVSSSILGMTLAHINAEKKSIYNSTEKVQVITLDSIIDNYLLPKKSNLFLKIDTQGFEWQVLLGGNKTVKSAIGIMLELSLVELYTGQKLMGEILDYMNNLGFTLWSISPEFIDPVSGQTLQIDAIFLNKAHK